jgi:hypothetical protein
LHLEKSAPRDVKIHSLPIEPAAPQIGAAVSAYSTLTNKKAPLPRNIPSTLLDSKA